MLDQPRELPKCRPVTPKDYDVINAWYRGHHMPPLCEHLFPDVGYVVDGIGAGFIYQTDSSLCFIEGYISNPDSGKDDRKEAFDQITNCLIRVAKDFGFKAVLAYTQHPEIAKRCERFHFQYKGTYNLFLKGL